VRFSQILRQKITAQPIEPIEIPTEPSVCERCGSDKIIKHGLRHNQSGIVQRYKCKDCGHKFIINYGFEKAKASPKAITASLDLYFKGVSLRKITDHLKQFYNVKVSHVAVIGWIRKFVKVVKPYVDSFTPQQLSGIWHVDEMMVHVRKEEMDKGHYAWLWNLMDDTTRFWISSKISQRRETSDARNIFQDAKNKAGNPLAIVHDGLPSYHEAYNKEFYTNKGTKPVEVRSVSVRRKHGKNALVERMQGSIRDREKVMRGLDNKESAQDIADAMRINYNFVRPHQSLNGKTPAEVAGIDLKLGNNRIESLVRKSILAKKTC